MRREEYRYNTLDLDDDVALGILLPLTGPNQLFRQSYTSEDQAISNLKSLLLTAKGERIMLPNFGSDLPKYLFENFDEDLLSKIENEVVGSIRTWLPYINVQDVRVYTRDYGDNLKTNLEYHTIFVELDFTVDPYENFETIVLFVSQEGISIVEESNG